MSGGDPFSIRHHVADFSAIRQGFVDASRAARTRLHGILDIPYGDGPDERLDIFLPAEAGRETPVHLFIHGGYWRAFSKDDYSFVAETVTRAGAIAAIAGYSLMPGARMAALVGQVRRAAHWLAENITSHGGNPEAISASGHSAGAHLAFHLAARGPAETGPPPALVRHLLLVSGVYDLRPIPRSFLQAEIGLTPAEIAAFSPVDAHLMPGAKLTLAVGGDETNPFHEQAHALAARNPGRASVETLPGTNHMTIMRDLGHPKTAAARLLMACIAASRR